MRETLDVPAGFSFRRTVFSHGWYSLPPFSVAADGSSLSTTVELSGDRPRRLTVGPARRGVVWQVPGRPSARVRDRLRAATRRMLGLDVDLSEFHERAAARAETRWIAETGSGRLLRAPTAFEDLIKLVLTTNCTWSSTQRMVGTLVGRYGRSAAEGPPAFPRPVSLERAGEGDLRERVRTGYRAPHLWRLARDTARGSLRPSAWDRDRRDDETLRADLLELPGVGPYVADNVMRMLGRPCGLGLDSWLRAKYGRVYHGGRRVGDRTIARRYARFGRWAGLALWCEMTRDWFEDENPVRALLAESG